MLSGSAIQLRGCGVNNRRWVFLPPDRETALKLEITVRWLFPAAKTRETSAPRVPGGALRTRVGGTVVSGWHVFNPSIDRPT